MSNIKPNLIYDVGLHQGEDTDFYLKKGFDVVAFEANPELVAHCKGRFQDAIARGRLRIIDGAIAPETSGGTVVFYKNPISVWGTVAADWAERNTKLGYASEKIELSRIDIDTVFKTLGMPFYLKIDVEGVDRLVLSALANFEQRPQFVSIESEKVDFAALGADLELLRSLGYNKFKPVQQESVPGTVLKTNTLDGTPIEHVFEHHSSGPFGDDIPQPWLDFDEALKNYQIIFDRYRRFGDNSEFASLLETGPETGAGNSLRSDMENAYRTATGYRGPLPGWHDIHAGR